MCQKYTIVSDTFNAVNKLVLRFKLMKYLYFLEKREKHAKPSQKSFADPGDFEGNSDFYIEFTSRRAGAAKISAASTSSAAMRLARFFSRAQVNVARQLIASCAVSPDVGR